MNKILLFPILLLFFSLNSLAVTSAFTANVNNACAAPLTVTFSNLSTSASAYYWDFGDNTNDTITNPVHIYSSPGLFTVKLYAYDLTGGIDSTIMVDYINIDPSLTCANLVPTNQNTPQTACFGILYDSGGPIANYTTTSTSTRRTISPIGATSVSLTFKKFELEPNNDSLEIYVGATITANSVKIGTYYGNTLPNGGLPIVVTGAAITVRMRTNTSVTAPGFEAIWQCTQAVTPPPVAAFSASDTATCLGTINFTDLSTNNPSAWLWDFGDGTTSNVKNPVHVFANNGTYTVSLITTNSFGSDTIIKTNYIDVNRPTAATIVTGGSTCVSGQVLLTATPSSPGNILRWYASDTTATILATGNSLLTPSISAPTNFYVEELVNSATIQVGPADNLMGTGGNNNTSWSMIFNSSAPCVLQSVKVYSTATGNRTIELRTATGTVLASTTVNIGIGQFIIPLNFNIPVGTGLRLTAAGTFINLYRNNAGAVYPYTNGPISITGNTAGAQALTFYYFFYDWSVSTVCQSLRTPVLANIGSITPYASTNSPTTICTGDTAVLSAIQGVGYSYSWNESGTPIVGATNANLNVINAGSYTCDISSVACTSATTSPIIIALNQAPTSQIIYPTQDTAYRCLGVPFLLKADTGNGTNTYQWYRNGAAINAANVDSFTVIQGGGAFNNIYTVETFNSLCPNGTLSAPFTLFSYSPPNVVVTPFITQFFCGTSGTELFTATLDTSYNYQWLFNGSPISVGGQNNTYTATALGSYSVTATSNSYCPTDTSNIVQIQSSSITASFTYNANAGETIVFTNTTTGAISYLWNFGDGTPTATTQNPTHTYADTLVHTVTLIVTNINGCSDTITQVIDVHPSGINEINYGDAISIYPVPSNDFINIKINSNIINKKTIIANIYNTLGMLVQTNVVNKNNQTISIADLENGSYFIRMQIGNSFVNKKIIKN